jgi:hypothetical protein
MSTTLIVVVMAATSAARLTAAAPLTLHREFTIVLMVRFGRRAWPSGRVRVAPRFKKPVRLGSGRSKQRQALRMNLLLRELPAASERLPAY